MKAMVLQRYGEPLTLMDRLDPQPSATEVRVTVAACGVCRTDLHVVDGELLYHTFPIILGMRSSADQSGRSKTKLPGYARGWLATPAVDVAIVLGEICDHPVT